MVEEVVFDHDVAEGAFLEEQALLGSGVAGDVVGEGDVFAAAEDLPEVLVVLRGCPAGWGRGRCCGRRSVDRGGRLDVVGGRALDRVVGDREACDAVGRRDPVAVGGALRAGVVEVVDVVAFDQDVGDLGAGALLLAVGVEAEGAGELVVDELEVAGGAERLDAACEFQSLEADVGAWLSSE